MEAYIGAIWSFGFNFPPRGWALCNGALLPISQYDTLYALIGTTYGGDGQTTFALPNLQGRVPIGTGQGPGLPNYVLGQMAGSESVTLTAANLPMHTHMPLSVSMGVSARGGEAQPANNYFGASDSSIGNTYATTGGSPMAAGAPAATGLAGSSQPLSIMSPYQVISYCICLEGIFPSRN